MVRQHANQSTGVLKPLDVLFLAQSAPDLNLLVIHSVQVSKALRDTLMAVNNSLKSTILLLATLSQAACVLEVHSSDYHHDISRVFGGVDVAAGQTVGDVDSVNGSITLGDDSRAEHVQTVNGSIRARDDVQVMSLETVNGSIRAGRNLKVEEDVSTVNGGIELKSGTVIGDRLTTVNGSIRLHGAEVVRDVETVNGDIRLSDGSTITGDVIFRDTGGRFNWNHKRPRLIVDADSSIKGTIYLYREVVLEIHEDARVGEIVEDF